MKKNNLFTCMAISMALMATACGNNGDLPKEDNYQNTTESAPESTDNMTGYGNIGDSTATESAPQDSGATTGTTSGTTDGSSSATTGSTTSGASSPGTTGSR